MPAIVAKETPLDKQQGGPRDPRGPGACSPPWTPPYSGDVEWGQVGLTAQSAEQEEGEDLPAEPWQPHQVHEEPWG